MAPQRITARDLRRAAEAALGKRADPLGVIPKAAGIDVVKREIDSAGNTLPTDPHANDYILEINADAMPVKPKQLKVQLPDVKVNGNPLPDNDFFNFADAVFWKAPALEKFVLPYYASFVDLADLQKLVVEKFAQPGVLAMIHLPDSEVDGGEGLLKFADSKVPNLGVVTRDESGALKVEPLI